MKIGFIGGGNIARAMISAMQDEFKILVYARSKNSQIASKFNVEIFNSELEIAKNSDIIILAIKPKDYESILNLIKNMINNQIVLLLAPNFSISQAECIIGKKKIVRAMPNMPISIKEGVVSISFNETLSKNERENLIRILSSLGKIYEIDELQIPAFTGIAGSLPAYVFMFIEALADAGVLNGISRQMAYDIVSNAVCGSAKLVATTNTHPAKLKDAVCSPSGTTIEAVRTLEKHGFRFAIMDAVNECIKKAKK